ncbi:LLM class flavin-dependent oxidoreductase [Streptomyces sp. NPDC088725]|uniref:LLM class flavin-dependent oxidoreductase n=1 Tax=Streptomyces sp. NPDC088725 TaxID=3365873 RepID=UPI00382F6308
MRDWARTVEGLSSGLLMVSDHVVVTPDVAARYPAPFCEPFTTLSWPAGVTERVRPGAPVLIVPYRDPLLAARMGANLSRLRGERRVPGLGVGWARQEFAALGVPFERRGALTDAYPRVIKDAWEHDKDEDYPAGRIPLWVGGHSNAGLRRAVRLGDAWHPLRFTMPWLREALERLRTIAYEEQRPVPEPAPRIALRLTGSPVTDADRLAGVGTMEQVVADLAELSDLGAGTVPLDTFNGDPSETDRPEDAWQTLETVAAEWDLRGHHGVRASACP